MIITGEEAMQYIPFSTLTRSQVAELMGRSTGAVDYYVAHGLKTDGITIYLRKQSTGKFLTSDVVDFIKAVKSS